MRIIASSYAFAVMTELHYTQEGSGNPVVLLHGLFGSGVNLGSLAKKLAVSHRVIVADLRNHGRSPHASGMTYVDMAEDLETLLDRLGIARADFVGHSMGGKAAMVLALTRPHCVRHLVVVDIAPVRYAHSYLPIIQVMENLDLSRLRSRKDADRHLAAAVPDDASRMFLLQNLMVQDGRYQWRLNLTAIKQHTDEILGFPGLTDRSFGGPTLFLAGAQSEYVLEEHRHKITKLFPAARIEWIAGAGHWVHVDQPQALFETLQDFLDANPVSAEHESR